jgi:RNA polymerase sigma-70 factor, ECF subfamily
MTTFTEKVNPGAPALGESTGLADAFRNVFDAEFGYVCRALRRLGVRDADLKDVAQELFVTVHERFGERDASRSIRPWLFAFALRFAANYRKLARHRADLTEAIDARTEAGDARTEARDLVLRALSRVEFERRSVLVMHDLEGFGATDIADQCGIPLNTVYSRLRLARDEFRSAIATLQKRGLS